MNVLNNIVLIQKNFITFQKIKSQFTIIIFLKKTSQKNYYKKTQQMLGGIIKEKLF